MFESGPQCIILETFKMAPTSALSGNVMRVGEMHWLKMVVQ